MSTSSSLSNSSSSSSSTKNSTDEKKYSLEIKQTIVRFDIGGKIVHTTIQTLNNLNEKNLFTQMISAEPNQVGPYFIDRDPKEIQTILNYFRDKTIDITLMNKSKLNRLKCEAQYYKIDSLVKFLTQEDEKKVPLGWMFSHCALGVTISTNGMIASSSSGTDGSWTRSVLGHQAPIRNGCRTYVIRLVSANNRLVMVGLNRLDTTLAQANLYSLSGYYYYMHSGQLYGPGQQDQAYGRAVNVGESVTIIHDIGKQTILFSVSGHGFGVAFRAVPDDLYPIALFYNLKDQVSFVYE